MTKEQINGFSYRIMQATPTQLVIVLMEMVATYLNDAYEAHNEGNMDNYKKSIKLAIKGIEELSHSLDFNYEISLEFFQIYGYAKRELQRALYKNDCTNIIRIAKMMLKLSNAFDKVKQEDHRGCVMQNTQQVYAGLTYGKNSLNESFGLESNRGYRV